MRIKFKHKKKGGITAALFWMWVHHRLLSHRYQAVYNYMPRNEDELELKEGDIVDVMEKCDDGWFVGKKREFWVSYW